MRVVLAVPENAPWQTAADLPEGVRIVAEFPSLTSGSWRRTGSRSWSFPFLQRHQGQGPGHRGRDRGPRDRATCLHNGLRILDTLLSSYTELVASAAAYADQDKRAAMEDIALLLRGAIQARGNVLLKLNVPADKLPAVTEHAARAVVPDDPVARAREHERGRDRGAQARRQHADSRR